MHLIFNTHNISLEINLMLIINRKIVDICSLLKVDLKIHKEAIKNNKEGIKNSKDLQIEIYHKEVIRSMTNLKIKVLSIRNRAVLLKDLNIWKVFFNNQKDISINMANNLSLTQKVKFKRDKAEVQIMADRVILIIVEQIAHLKEKEFF